MFDISIAFNRPLYTVAILAAVGFVALFLQWIFAWIPQYAPTEFLLIVFACAAVYSGSAISSRVLPRLRKLEAHLTESSPSKREFQVALTIRQHEWLVVGFLGLIVAIGALYTIHVIGLPWSGFTRAVLLISMFLNFWVAGTACGLYGLALVWIWRLSNQETRIKPFAWRPELLAGASNVYLQITS